MTDPYFMLHKFTSHNLGALMMLQTIAKAIHVKGRKNAQIARDLERNPHTVQLWFSGRNPIPARVRQALDAAIGHPVDWPAYDAEFAAKARATRPAPSTPDPAPQRPASAPPAQPAPSTPAPAPQRPATARQRPAGDPWGADPAPAPAPAPAAPPAKRRGLLSALLSDDDEGEWI